MWRGRQREQEGDRRQRREPCGGRRRRSQTGHAHRGRRRPRRGPRGQSAGPAAPGSGPALGKCTEAQLPVSLGPPLARRRGGSGGGIPPLRDGPGGRLRSGARAAGARASACLRAVRPRALPGSQALPTRSRATARPKGRALLPQGGCAPARLLSQAAAASSPHPVAVGVGIVAL